MLSHSLAAKAKHYLGQAVLEKLSLMCFGLLYPYRKKAVGACSDVEGSDQLINRGNLGNMPANLCKPVMWTAMNTKWLPEACLV